MSAHSIWRELLDSGGGWALLSRWRVDARAEGLHLDFKNGSFLNNDVAPDDRKNLARGMSAFGNTEGGLLIFGADTKRDQTSKADRLKALPGISPVDVYAERLRVHASDSTTPRISGLDIRPFEDPNRPGTGVVVVYVPLNDGLPYRAEGPDREVNGRYFIRTTTDTAQMSHQLLAAMFGRVPPPRLRLGAVRTPADKHVRFFVDNVGRGCAVLPFVRMRVVGFSAEGFQATAYWGWSDRRQNIALVGHGEEWPFAFCLEEKGRIYPGEQRLLTMLPPLPDSVTIQARLDCDGAMPVRIDETIQLSDTIQWLGSHD